MDLKHIAALSVLWLPAVMGAALPGTAPRTIHMKEQMKPLPGRFEAAGYPYGLAVVAVKVPPRAVRVRVSAPTALSGTGNWVTGDVWGGECTGWKVRSPWVGVEPGGTVRYLTRRYGNETLLVARFEWGF